MIHKLVIFIVLYVFFVGNFSYAQDEITIGSIAITCGDIIESDFTENFERQPFTISLDAGDSLNASTASFGERLKTAILLAGPTNLIIAANAETSFTSTGFYAETERQPSVNSGRVDATGTYRLLVLNYDLTSIGLYPTAIGRYTLFVGCTRDGIEIPPGSNIPTPAPISTPSPIETPVNGFPGLPPVDFDNGIIQSILLDAPNLGTINPSFSGVFGYKLNGNKDDVISLKFSRESGNLNLGLAVISQDNQVVYMVAMASSQTMSSTFFLPSAGEYTIGVFQLDLIPLAEPEATEFKIQVNVGQ